MTEDTRPGDEHLRGLLARIEETNRAMREAVEPLDAAGLARRPPAGGWSVGEVLEHLVVAGGIYNDHTRSVLDGARHARRPESGPWRPSMMGGFLVRGLDPRSARRVPAPKIFKPGPQPRPDVFGAFLDTQRELAGLIRRAEDFDLARVRTYSPVSRLIRINLGDCLTIPVVHAERHLQQIRRVLEH
jgi:hypothetical protein